METFCSLLSTRTLHTYDANIHTSTTSTNQIQKKPTQIHNITDNPNTCDCSTYLPVIHTMDLVPTSRQWIFITLQCHHMHFQLVAAINSLCIYSTHTTDLTSGNAHVHSANSPLPQPAPRNSTSLASQNKDKDCLCPP